MVSYLQTYVLNISLIELILIINDLFTTAQFIKADVSSNAVAHLQGKKSKAVVNKIIYHHHESHHSRKSMSRMIVLDSVTQ